MCESFENLLAAIALKIEGAFMWVHLTGQDLVTCREVKAMFGGGNYPDEVWPVVSGIEADTTRQDLLRQLRVIANRNYRGRIFAEALDPAELASLN